MMRGGHGPIRQLNYKTLIGVHSTMHLMHPTCNYEVRAGFCHLEQALGGFFCMCALRLVVAHTCLLFTACAQGQLTCMCGVMYHTCY